jgi:hypothetical protein
MIYYAKPIILCFLLSMAISTLCIRLGLRRIKRTKPADAGKEPPRRPWMTGFLIGLFETILIFVFVIEAEYSALAIIVAAKQYVRKDDIKDDPEYYLLGTMCNLAIAVLFALVARSLIKRYTGVLFV